MIIWKEVDNILNSIIVLYMLKMLKAKSYSYSIFKSLAWFVSLSVFITSACVCLTVPHPAVELTVV